MPNVKSSFVAILAISLLASAAIGASAQGEAATSFTADLAGPPIEFSFDEDTYLERLVFEMEATDPRADGVLTLLAARGGLEDDDYRYTVSRESVRLATDEGAWVGTAVSAGLHDLSAETNRGGAVFELVGEGGFEGLSMFITAAPDEPWQGMIIPTEMVPPQPEPPAE
jgi:hypothetical protein